MIFYTFFCPCLWIEFLVRLCWTRGQAKPGYLGSGPRVPGGRGGPGGIWGCPRGSEGFCAGISYFQLIFSFSAAALRSGGQPHAACFCRRGSRQPGKGAKARTEKGERGGLRGYFPLCLRPVLISLPSLSRKIPLEEKKKVYDCFQPLPRARARSSPGAFRTPRLPRRCVRGRCGGCTGPAAVLSSQGV